MSLQFSPSVGLQGPFIPVRPKSFPTDARIRMYTAQDRAACLGLYDANEAGRSSAGARVLYEQFLVDPKYLKLVCCIEDELIAVGGIGQTSYPVLERRPAGVRSGQTPHITAVESAPPHGPVTARNRYSVHRLWFTSSSRLSPLPPASSHVSDFTCQGQTAASPNVAPLDLQSALLDAEGWDTCRSMIQAVGIDLAILPTIPTVDFWGRPTGSRAREISSRRDVKLGGDPEGHFTMKAVVFTEFGGLDEAHISDVPDPIAGPGEVLVTVHAASVNGADHKVRRGDSGYKANFLHILGRDFSGVVSAVGPNVHDFAAGDAVFGVLSSVGLKALTRKSLRRTGCHHRAQTRRARPCRSGSGRVSRNHCNLGRRRHGEALTGRDHPGSRRRRRGRCGRYSVGSSYWRKGHHDSRERIQPRLCQKLKREPGD